MSDPTPDREVLIPPTSLPPDSAYGNPLDALRAENDRLRRAWDQSGKNDLLDEVERLRATVAGVRSLCDEAENGNGTHVYLSDIRAALDEETA